jgi:hypothetical protein
MLCSSIMRHNKFVSRDFNCSFVVSCSNSSECDTFILSKQCSVDPCMLKAAAPIGAPTQIVVFCCVIFWTMEMMVFMINDFSVPPQPIRIVRRGLYFVSLFKNFTIVSINASTTACCCSDRASSV